MLRLALAFIVLAGCGSDPAAPPRLEGPLTATLSGLPVPDGSVAALVWQVTSGTPDYLFKEGQAAVTSGTVTLEVADPPNPATLNSYGVGVAFVIVFPADLVPDEGMLVPGDLDVALGVGDYTLVYRQKTAQDLYWSDSFPSGYACGRCSPPPAGERFSGFTAVSCDDLTITLAPDDDAVCNWT